MWKTILALLAGLLAGMIVIFAVEAISHAVYPTPVGLDMKDPAAVAAYAKTVPVGARLFIILAWVLGSFTAGWVGALIRRNTGPLIPCTLGAILTAGGVMQMIMIPSPWWFWVLGLLAFLPFTIIGYRVPE